VANICNLQAGHIAENSSVDMSYGHTYAKKPRLRGDRIKYLGVHSCLIINTLYRNAGHPIPDNEPEGPGKDSVSSTRTGAVNLM
jgi:hypothetical protein